MKVIIKMLISWCHDIRKIIQLIYYLPMGNTETKKITFDLNG